MPEDPRYYSGNAQDLKPAGLRFFRMALALMDSLGRKADLATPGFLSRTFRDEVPAEAEVVYDATR